MGTDDIELNKIYNMPCEKGLALLPDNSVDLTVTSPPYDNLRKYNGFTWDFETVAKELFRVTKVGGVVVWVVSDATINGSETGTSFKQALFFKDCGFNLHDTMIYSKKNHLPLSHDRYEQQFEYMFIFSKGKPKVFNPIKIPCKYAGTTTWGNATVYKTKDSNRTEIGKVTIKDKKIKGNIFEYIVGSINNKETKHPAIFPEELAHDHIISWSNENDLVLDCFMGSGTTAKVASILNRNFIGFEISEEYCKIATQRLAQTTNLFTDGKADNKRI